MVFSSNVFLLYFLPLFLICYFVCPKRFRNYIILLFSIVFYAWGAPDFILWLLGSTIANFFLVKLMHKTEKKPLKKLYCGLAIAVSLGLLVYYKYANFLIDNLNALISIFGANPIRLAKVLLPIGISFFTFQSITYVLDTYRGHNEPMKKLSDYMVYIMMFPQLIAGPIVRYCDIEGEIRHRYTMQLYFDFAGYSDMAIGLGRMMGFHFPENFDNPYNSASITEFWRRWHITLGAFMRNYLYIPLGGNRCSKRRMYFNLWVVFLLSGLWHGASWNFVVWGAYHGLWLVLERMGLKKFYEKIGKVPSVIITFIIAMVGWAIFRIEDLGEAFTFISRLFAFDFSSFGIKADAQFYTMLIIALVFSFITLFPFGKKMQDAVYYKEEYSIAGTIVAWVVAVFMLLFCIAAINAVGFSPFIYFRF